MKLDPLALRLLEEKATKAEDYFQDIDSDGEYIPLGGGYYEGGPGQDYPNGVVMGVFEGRCGEIEIERIGEFDKVADAELYIALKKNLPIILEILESFKASDLGLLNQLRNFVRTKELNFTEEMLNRIIKSIEKLELR